MPTGNYGGFSGAAGVDVRSVAIITDGGRCKVRQVTAEKVWIVPMSTRQSMSLSGSSVVDASRATCIIDDDDLFDMWVSIEVERQARYLLSSLSLSIDGSLPRVSFNTTPSATAVLKAIAGDDYFDPLYTHLLTFSFVNSLTNVNLVLTVFACE